VANVARRFIGVVIDNEYVNALVFDIEDLPVQTLQQTPQTNWTVERYDTNG